MKLLLVEDDTDLAENVIDYFELNGCFTDYAMSGEVALELLKTNKYDAVVLDINLPGIDGFEVCRQVRRNLHLNIPVLMLTARTLLDDKLEGFTSGTDDFLPKPFELAELKVRLQALCRRAKQGMAQLFCVEDLCIDPEKGIVTRGGHELNLPHICFVILVKMMEQYPGFVTKEDLEYAIWRDEPPMTDALKVHFHTLRQIVDKPFAKQLIHSIRGRGYKISSEGGES